MVGTSDPSRKVAIPKPDGFVEFTVEECEKSIPARFESIVSKHADRLAVKTKNHQLNYDQFNRMANRIARAILERTGEKEEPVALLLDHDAPLIASLLGVLKAGKVYLPLDPAFPEERNAYMLEDSQAALILTNGKHRLLAESLSKSGHRFLNIDEISADTPDTNPGLDLAKDRLAYILYTSGSTGQPKGVMHTHINVLRTARRTTNGLCISRNDRLSLLASCNVTGSVIDIFGALLNGATLLPFSVKTEGLDALVDWLLEEKITVYHSVATLFRHFASGLTGPDNFPHLRVARMGGEPCLRQDLELYQKHFSPNCILVNAGGCSETGSTVWQFNADHRTQIETATVPIGYPNPDIKLLLLDEQRNPVSVGEVGEIVIESRFLSPGYWRKPELTREKFQDAPDGGGYRIYFTGDLAYRTEEGFLVHAGRSDFQVKIRGYRIETAEIEQTIVSLGTIKEAVVMARDDKRGEKQLIAYIVTKSGSKPTFAHLRTGLKGRLPDYMLPAVFIVLDRLPQTPNGKLDRLALPDPETAESKLEKDFVPPSTPTEQTVAAVFGEVLGRERVGSDDHFFELGGHSLLAIRALSRLQKAFEIELPLRSLFEAPTVSEMAARIEVANQSDSILRAPPIRQAPGDHDLPLSFAQQRLWFFDQLEPNSAAFNMSTGARVEGPLNVGALEKAFNEILRRHEVLRTVYSSVNGRPSQSVTPFHDTPLPRIDLTDLSQGERESEVKRICETESARLFDLSKGPFLRMKVLHLTPDHHRLLITMHHIASDGWSKGVLFRELGALYEAFAEGKPSPLPELPVQYKDFAVWQREWLSGDVLRTQIAYWKQQLNGVAPVLELPTDRQRPAVQTYNGAQISSVLPFPLLTQLQTFSHGQGTTLFMTLLTAFNILLHRLSGQQDIVVGTPIAGRNRAEIENLIGFFLNTLALRADLSGNPTFRELLERMRAVALGAYAHQDLPFEKIVEEVQPQRSLSHSPIFQVLFNMYDYEIDVIELRGLKVQVLPPASLRSRFDLTLYVRQRPEKTELVLMYNTDLFDQARMAEMMQQFELLLSQIHENPDERVDRYSIVTAAARKHLPDPALPLARGEEESLPEMFSRQARRSPDHPAIIDGNETWTYGQLESRSNQLANYLISHGIRRGDVVAIYRHRSATLVWALLGVLKSGAVFSILDPVRPTAALIERLELLKPRGWLKLAQSEEISPALDEYKKGLGCVCELDLLAPSGKASNDPLASCSSEPPNLKVQPDDLAYLVCTSGTTGKPKGILGTHRPVTHFLKWHAATFKLTTDDRFSMLSGLGHDPLLRDIFTPLSLGGIVVIPGTDDLEIPGRLGKWLQKHEITVAHLTPAMGQMAMVSKSQKIPSLRYAFFGGDMLTSKDACEFKSVAPNVRCVNFYGTTETPQAMSYHPLTADEATSEPDGRVAAKQRIPVGRGIADAQLLVLNDASRLCGIGELGEIHVRTPYLAVGYLGDEALTRQRFMVNPFTSESSDRIYKTGDLGRCLPNGEIEIEGRRDQQIKIRGYRIEPGEIEAALARHPAVRENAVIAHESLGDRQLAAYVVIRENQNVTARNLRDHLKDLVPAYLIPASFVFLDAIPLTPNGKLDRQALPAPDKDLLHRGDIVAPRTPVEKALADIWSEVLQVRPIGIHDNFFELGGHSLLATRVISRVNQDFDMQMPLRKLFESPTIEGLALIIAEMKVQDLDSEEMGRLLAELEGASATGAPSQP